ncbi:type II secretion system minor pseudopilin GspH [Thalassotalea sediminis]|uniref:type II secretion system minor pseudopilin GspH n=1 Tax=Thalassotalea sediminis TaxID=1759089 RepID=UPI002572D4EA|nr:type II secretion system minor pseudopilin GspH [Thalassotalea sediminis]
MMFRPSRYSTVKGFTLIEILMVIVVIGFMVAAVQISFISNKYEQRVNQEAERFTGVFNLAADHGLLNNIELGLHVTENSYQFLGYDGTRWVTLPNVQELEQYKLPEGVSITLSFDGLAPEQNSTLIDRELFTVDDETLDAMEEALEEGDKLIIPQVYLLTGGEITPFIATFSSVDNTQEPYSIDVVGQYSAPISIQVSNTERENP